MTRNVTSLLTSIVGKQHGWKIQLLNNWDRIVGNLGTKVCIEKIDGDTLILSVENSCWLQELYLLSHVLLKNINDNLDRPRIKHLRFKTAGIKRKKKRTVRPDIVRKNEQPVSLTKKEEDAIKNVQDKEVRESLRKILMRRHQE